jgi:hypothetical protein
LSENQPQLRKMKWTDEDKGKTLIETAGLAASVKNNHNHQMNSTFTNMSRIEETSAHARGPHNPLAISQPLKLKSLLKGSTVEYIIVKPNIKEKSRRPMSSSTISKRPSVNERKMNSSFVGREGLTNTHSN